MDLTRSFLTTDSKCPTLTTMQGGHRHPKIFIGNSNSYLIRRITPEPIEMNCPHCGLFHVFSHNHWSAVICIKSRGGCGKEIKNPKLFSDSFIEDYQAESDTATLKKYEKTYDYLSQIIIQNLEDFKTILEWNEANGFKFFRISSEIFPFFSHPVHGYKITDLPNAHIILSMLTDIGNYAKAHNHRLTTHPGPYNVLASPNPDVVSKAVLDLEAHSTIFDLMGFTPSPYNKINIHNS